MALSSGVKNMLLASFFFSLMQICVKYLPHIPAIEIVFFRSLVSLVISYFFLKSGKVDPFGSNKKWLILRGLVGAFALILFFLTVQEMPLASAVTFQFLSPVFTAILGVYLLKEKVTPKQYIYFALAFFGVALIKGFDSRVSIGLAILGVVSAFFSGLAYNIIRKIGSSEHPLVIVLYFPLVTLPITAIISLFIWVTPTYYDWLLLLLVGIFTQLAQYFMTLSYQNSKVAGVAIVKYVGILYALVFGYVLFDETMPAMSLLGIVLVLSGVVLNVRTKDEADK
ncbi:MAG: DMT family transporter [Bacteroidota bacterium]